MPVSFPSEEPRKMDRLLAILETGTYPAMAGEPALRQEPLYGTAQGMPTPSEWILPGPNQTDVVGVNPLRQESMRRLLPQWRW